VLTASSVAGKFSNSEITINSSLHFNVTYTTTGVVLTVASGAAAVRQTSGAAQTVAEITKSSLKLEAVNSKSAVLIRGVRGASGAGEISRHSLVAGWEVADRSEWNHLRSWERIPVVRAWPVVEAQMPRAVNETPVYSQPASGAGMGGEGRTTGVSSPLRGWMSPSENRRAPVRILSPTLLRMPR
jgi:hypothetical protein